MKHINLLLSVTLASTLALFGCGGGGGGGASGPRLSSLTVEDSSHTGIQLAPAFDPSVTKYTLAVQEDILGVLISAKGPAGASITIESDINVDDLVGGNGAAHTPDPSNTSFIGGLWQAGQDWPNIHHPEGTATVRTLRNPNSINDNAPQWNDNGSYHGPSSVKAEVKVSEGGEETVYTITINVADGTSSYALFEQNEGAKAYTSGPNRTYLPYNLYVPKDIGANEKLPVVYAMHGSGQKTQPVDMILKRYQMATVWAKDSAAGHNRAIVLAPQSTSWDFSAVPALHNKNGGSDTSWYTGNSLGNWDWNDLAEDAFDLLTKLVDGQLPGYESLAGHVDTDRIYITGLSMGGGGTLATLKNHAEYFAAAIPVCANLLVSVADAQALNAKNPNLKWYFIHAYDDPTVDIGYTYTNIRNLISGGYSSAAVKDEIYPTGTHLYEAAHFSWIPGYQNESIRDWLFAQKK
jgi:poly(3-hydroxybutyrate) depolymerase